MRRLVLIILLSLLTFSSNAQFYGANPSAALLNIATRTYLPWFFFATNKQVMARNSHISFETLSSVKLEFWNGYIDTNSNTNTYTELGTGATATITASIEYPAGTFTQVLFSGSATGSVTSGSLIISDALSVSIPANTQYWTRVFYNNSAGILFNSFGNSNLGDRLQAAVSGLTDLTMSGSIPDSNPNDSLPPVAIIASTIRQSHCLIGTSRTVGINDTIDSTGNLGIQARSIGAGYPYIMMGVPGDNAAHFVSSHTTRAQLANALCSAVDVEHGVNDDQSQLATVEANLTTIYNLFPTKRVYAYTVDPNTTSSDTWITLGNQTIGVDFSPLNTWLRTKPIPLFGLYDIAPIVNSSQKWIVNGTANWCTNDGIHENFVCQMLIKNSGQVAP